MARLGNVFNNKEDIRKEEQHPRRTIKWIHYTKLKENPGQYCPERDKEEIEALADLIEAAGEVIQNLSVSKLDTDEYRIIAGHKRCKACKLLVEERGLKQFSFLPCVVSNLSSVQEEFQVVASNGYHQKKAYELMHEILKTEKLLKEHPEEFPESLQKGRMIERLSRKMGIARSTIQEYKQISNNLTSEAMEKFKNGEIEKSAAVTLSKMPEESQKRVIGQGITQNVEIEKYRQENLEPNSVEIKVSFRLLDIGKYDKSTVTRDALVKFLKGKFGYNSYTVTQGEFTISCTSKTISISGKTVSWERYVKLLNLYCPRKEEEDKPVENTIKECNEDSMKKTPIPEVLSKDTVNVSGNELQSTEQAIPMDTIIEEDDGGAEAPEEEMILPDSEEQSVEMIPEETVHSTGINRQAWIGNLSTKDMAQYLSRNLSVSTLKSPDQLFNWLSDIVDNDGRFLEEGNQVR